MKMNLIIRLIVIVAFLAALYLISLVIGKWIKSVDAGVTAAIVTAIAGIFGILYSQWHTKTKEISEGHRPQKIALYDTFFDIIEHFMRNEREKKTEKGIPNALKKKFEKLNRGMIIWASPGVINAWLEFRRGPEDPNQNTPMLVDSILREIRKDLGNSNWGLSEGDTVRILLKNVDELNTTTENITTRSES